MKISEKNGVYYLDEGKLELYTPQKYMGSINTIDGDKANIMGLVLYKYYDKVTDTKPVKVGVLNDPSMVVFYPVDIQTNVMDNIWGNKYDITNTNEYTVLQFEKGSRLMNKDIVCNLDNVTLFMDLLLGSKIDNNIPYNMLAQCWIKNIDMNRQNLEVPFSIINLIIYKLCVSQKNPNKQFGELFGKDPKISPVAYKFIGIRQICANDSVYTALSFEDMNSMIDASLNMTQSERDQKVSPLEQIIKY